MSEHTKLSASKSHRWTKCSGSVAAEEGLPDNSTIYGEEGKLAHLVAERMFFRSDYSDLNIPEEMEYYAKIYVDHLNNIFSKGSETSIYIEKKVDFSHIIPDNSGTADAIIVQPIEGKLYIIDFKYGFNKVESYENTQLLLYAMGALNTLSLYNNLHNIDTIILQIVQPRANNKIESWTLTFSELRFWEGYLKAKGEEALQPNAVRRPHEEACKYCKAKPTCPALYKLLPTTFQNTNLTTEEIKVVLDNSKLIRLFLDGIEERIYDDILSGNKFPGYKLTPGKNIRKLKVEAEEKLIELLGENAYTKSLRGIKELERLIDKEILASLVYIHSCKPQMVKDTNDIPSLEELNYDPV